MTDKTAQAQRLVELLQDGSLSRRQFVKRASALGLSAGALGTILAACGGDDDTATPAPAAEPEPAPPPPAPEPPPPAPEPPPPAPEPPPPAPEEPPPPAPEELPAADGSTASIATAEVDAEGLAVVETDEAKVAVANVDGDYFAFDDTCTHQGCSLATGSLNGSNVTCPCHGSTFDVTTGEVVNGPATKPVDVYAIEVVGDELEIDVS